jgi:hypothetical protein
MNAYEAAHLCVNQGVFFEGEVYGEVVSILDGLVKISWEDGAVTELHVEDFEGVDKCESPPRPRTLEPEAPTRPASSLRLVRISSHH